MEKEIDCLTDCNAFCCRRGIKYELTPKEVEALKQAGTEMKELVPPNLESGQVFVSWKGPLRIEDYLQKGLGIYLFLSDCGKLDGQKCGEHDNGKKPHACKDIMPGDRTCEYYREIAS